MIELQVVVRPLPELAGERVAGALRRQSLETLIGGVVRAERVLDVEPRQRVPRDVEVADRAVHVRRVLVPIDDPERIVVHAIVGGIRRIRIAIRPMQPVNDVREVVEVGRRAREAEEQPVEVVPLLHVARADIHVRHVPTEAQLAAEELCRLEARRRAVVLVVVADDRAVLERVANRGEERAAVIATGEREHVVERVPGGERFVPVVVRGGPGGELRVPSSSGWIATRVVACGGAGASILTAPELRWSGRRLLTSSNVPRSAANTASAPARPLLVVMSTTPCAARAP